MRDTPGPYPMHAQCPDCPSDAADYWPIVAGGEAVIGVGRCKVCNRPFAWNMGAP